MKQIARFLPVFSLAAALVPFGGSSAQSEENNQVLQLPPVNTSVSSSEQPHDIDREVVVHQIAEAHHRLHLNSRVWLAGMLKTIGRKLTSDPRMSPNQNIVIVLDTDARATTREKERLKIKAYLTPDFSRNRVTFVDRIKGECTTDFGMINGFNLGYIVGEKKYNYKTKTYEPDIYANKLHSSEEIKGDLVRASELYREVNRDLLPKVVETLFTLERGRIMDPPPLAWDREAGLEAFMLGHDEALSLPEMHIAANVITFRNAFLINRQMQRAIPKVVSRLLSEGGRDAVRSIGAPGNTWDERYLYLKEVSCSLSGDLSNQVSVNWRKLPEASWVGSGDSIARAGIRGRTKEHCFLIPGFAKGQDIHVIRRKDRNYGYPIPYNTPAANYPNLPGPM